MTVPSLRQAPHTLYDWARRQRQVLGDARRLTADACTERIAYLGYGGQRNIGDDAIVEAHERWTLGRPVVHLPVHYVPEVLRRSRRLGPGAPVLLGGGTLVGRPDWLERVRAYQRGGWASTWALCGVGVEDPEFAGRRVHASWADLRAWAEVLPLFGEVTVRGPLSQATLAAVGVPSRVVGDPALLFAAAAPAVAVQDRLVAMSVAVPEDVWGGDPAAAVDELGRAARALVSLGHRIRLVALHPADLAPSRAVAAAVGDPDAVEVHSPRDTTELLELIAPAAAMIGQRLHAVVLASALAVPSLAIEYRPKCLDFQTSLGRAEWTVSTRGMSADAVVERTRALLADRQDHADRLRGAVAGLVAELGRDGARVRRRMGLPEQARDDLPAPAHP